MLLVGVVWPSSCRAESPSTATALDPDDLSPPRRAPVQRRVDLRRALPVLPDLDPGGAVPLVTDDELDPIWTLAAPRASLVECGTAYWFGGWRPTTLVHLLYTESSRRFEAQLPDLLLGVRSGNLGDLSPAQLAQIDEVQRRTVAKEDELSREMGAVQEGHGAVGADGELDVDGLVGRVGAVLAGVDALRLRTMKRAIEILKPAQAAELLVAAADMEIGFREFGFREFRLLVVGLRLM